MSVSFADLGVPSRLVERLRARGITEAFPIQEAAIPDALAGSRRRGQGHHRLGQDPRLRPSPRWPISPKPGPASPPPWSSCPRANSRRRSKKRSPS